MPTPITPQTPTPNPYNIADQMKDTPLLSIHSVCSHP
jgi:hypothetical protein